MRGLLVGLLLAVFLSFMPAPTIALFGCMEESCYINMSTSRWYCSFSNCTEMPYFINQTNVTYANITGVVCNMTSFEEVLELGLENQTSELAGLIQAELAAAEPLVACEESRDVLLGEVSSCQDKLSNVEMFYVPRNATTSMILALRRNVTSLSEVLEKQKAEHTNQLMYVAAGVGLGMWYFFIRKKEPSQKTIYPTPGEVSYDATKVDQISKELDARQGFADESLQTTKSKVSKSKVDKTKGGV